ncbi:thymidine phosphorylase family protein [Thiomicrorhabdus sp. ZW0627]|uniref:thymidine phosphorylase family protein n=1 Tax=Thiomicrorhabdus sp. ZW0627 TaxID=3039774 RepID=UPI002436D76F|nr:thymidine phosphorylase family protein [Thiomicrorhabdus sp. ZW0627]MDG6773833.1 thymidine phosphorylase family protein [Thiomicrorhabdus sp. ZW0627]
MSTLKLRSVAIDTYKENVAYLHRNCEIYRSEGFQALNKIEVHASENGASVVAVLNVVDDDSIVEPGQLGLSEQVFEQFNLPEGSSVRICPATQPHSFSYVHRKIAGDELEYKHYLEIIQDIAANRYSKIEITAYLVACTESGMEREEVLHLTRAMVKTGERINWDEPLVVDKHCIGGIPGNRTSMLVVPIVAAHGLFMPKTSSRAITSPAGTADTMEVLSHVELSIHQLQKIVRQLRGCLAWGGTANLAPVDDVLISVERPLSMDSPGQMVASILSKKAAAGATHLIVDIPVGPTAKIRSHGTAMKLRKLFEFVGDNMGLQLEVMITDGRQPVGRGVGPVLEARDVVQVLENDPGAPQELREKALQLAGRIIEFDPDVRGGRGYAIARDILDSGRALEKFHAIVEAQGKRKRPIPLGELTLEVKADKAGQVTAINNFQIARIASLAGAPKDKGAGIDLHKKLGDTVEKGELLYTIYAEHQSDLNFTKEAVNHDSGYTIGK